MGISDEDYARAKQVQLVKKVQKAYEKQQMEKEMAKVSSNTYPTGITISNTTTATNAVWSAQPQGVKVLNEQDLKHDAMQAPLSALVDMWQMRWQGEWVSEADFVEDDFWRLALIRLVGANKLEKHHLASQYSAVYRIIE